LQCPRLLTLHDLGAPRGEDALKGFERHLLVVE
jgi:hypothetical protein